MINLGRPSFVLGLRTQNSHIASKTIQFGFDFIKSGHGVSDYSALGKVDINEGLKTKTGQRMLSRKREAVVTSQGQSRVSNQAFVPDLS